jgi:hypothetical protein
MRSRCCLCACAWMYVCVCLCIPPPPLLLGNEWLGKNPPIDARQRLGKNSPIDARQQCGRNVTVVRNTHTTIDELLDTLFSMWPMLYQGKQAIGFSSQNFLYCLLFSMHTHFGFMRPYYRLQYSSAYWLQIYNLITYYCVKKFPLCVYQSLGCSILKS